jgi:hypothetical protein
MTQFKSQIQDLHLPSLTIWIKVADLSKQNGKISGSGEGLFLHSRAANNFSTQYSMEIFNYFSPVLGRIRTAVFNTQTLKILNIRQVECLHVQYDSHNRRYALCHVTLTDLSL